MQVFKIKYGMGEDKGDAFGIRFNGDIDSKVKHFGSISEMFSGPDQSPIIKQRWITLWFTFDKLHPYMMVCNILSDLISALKEENYLIKDSSLDGLVDTKSHEYAGKPESEFPASEATHGCNATNGFAVTAEKTDDTSLFLMEEIETIQALAIKFGKKVYGRVLKKPDY